MQEALLRIYRHGGFRQFVIFILTGILNTIVGYSIFALAYLVVGNSNVAVIITTIVGATFNYFSYGKIVFSNVGYGALLRFIGAYCVVGALNIVLLEALRTMISRPLIAQLVLLPPLVAVSFTLNKFWVFRR